MPSMNSVLVALSLGFAAHAQHYTATYLPSNAPTHSEKGQYGTNKCGTAANQTSNCQNAYLNSLDDFCLFAPPTPGKNSEIGDSEQIEVSWCMQDGYGTRLIPDGSITGITFIQTPDFVQVTGVGDLTSMNIPKGDEGGELDPHGATGLGNPIGGLVFSKAFGKLEQIHEWTNFMAADEFCFRACKPGPKAPQWCEHVYDEQGCDWNMPGNYETGTFEHCVADSGQPMGVYGASTYHQGGGPTPPPHPAPSSSSCVKTATIGNGAIISASSIISISVSGSTPTPTSASASTATSPSGSTASSTSVSGGSSSGASSTFSLPGLVATTGTLIVGAMLGAVMIL
ncbi:hypothetical protein FIBSPDRAFT_856339 [Athelia psychrophila]|uniref:Carbohydrate-binding module family 13 protein n=1 Tax=Athelia psychrophila TaxID=1759441 RepID=A0A166NG98_9AGAM|nr:hypothetical protein FIBSPDRAFT_856339 [Fibularhizoctonia sp. CBS 109695]